MSEKPNNLRIHAQITPQPAVSSCEPKAVRWRCVPHPKQSRESKKLTFSDRLLRNSALACALLLAVLALGNINQPWARSVSQSIERALTMRIDLDDSIGQLSFVQKLMPESALVFLNLSGSTELARPLSGKLIHAFSDSQPWLLFECPAGSDVVAAESGTVTAVSELSGGTYGVLIDHGSGRESVYAYLDKAFVAGGDSVLRGQSIGQSGANLYFELRDGEISVDPSQMMGF